MQNMNLFETPQNFTSEPIQDLMCNLTFNLNGNTYTLNVNKKEERETIKSAINSNAEHVWDWFHEETGEYHWVLYNTEMYEICDGRLLYKNGTTLASTIPINATSCQLMFSNYKSSTSIDFSNFHTENIVDMKAMFASNKSLTHLDLTSFNTIRVRNMEYMFDGCKNLLTIDLTSFNTINVYKMAFMFSNCISITILDLSSFNTSGVIDMDCMFSNCSKLSKLNVANFYTNNVITFSSMFYNCASLFELDLHNFDTSSLENADFMFAGCKNLVKVNLYNAKISYALDLFHKCKSLSTVRIVDEETRRFIHLSYPNIRLI